jgi:hypothetical protein
MRKKMPQECVVVGVTTLDTGLRSDCKENLAQIDITMRNVLDLYLPQDLTRTAELTASKRC